MKKFNRQFLAFISLMLALASLSQAENYLSGVTVYVTDMEKSVAFYTKSFGFHVNRSSSTKTYDETIVSSSGEKGASLVLIKLKAETDKIGKQRIVFYVDDADAVADTAKMMGAAITRAPSEIKSMNIKLGLIQDPDNNTVEFIQRLK